MKINFFSLSLFLLPCFTFCFVCVTCLSFAILFLDTCRLYTAMFVWGFPVPCCIRRVYDCHWSLSLTPHGALFFCSIYSGPFTELFRPAVFSRKATETLRESRGSQWVTVMLLMLMTHQSKLRTPDGESVCRHNPLLSPSPYIFKICFWCVLCGSLCKFYFLSPWPTRNWYFTYHIKFISSCKLNWKFAHKTGFLWVGKCLCLEAFS